MYKVKARFLGKTIKSVDIATGETTEHFLPPHDIIIEEDKENMYLIYEENNTKEIGKISKHELGNFLNDYEILETIYES